MFLNVLLQGTRKINHSYVDSNGSEVNDVSVFKDHGVSFDRSLTFVDHITKISNHAMKLLGFITRNTKHFSNIFTLKNLYIVQL